MANPQNRFNSIPSSVDTADTDTTEWSPLPQHITIENLRNKLSTADIALHEWGQDSAKTVEHLLTEISEGESVLAMNSNGEIIRQVNVTWVDVLHKADNDNVYLLAEDRQEFNDGRVRTRQLPASLGEKMLPGEAPNEAASRALREELDNSTCSELHFVSKKENNTMSNSYPGLKCQYNHYTFVAMISPSSFKDSYVEQQLDKTNYYSWKLLHDGSDDR